MAGEQGDLDLVYEMSASEGEEGNTDDGDPSDHERYVCTSEDECVDDNDMGISGEAIEAHTAGSSRAALDKRKPNAHTQHMEGVHVSTATAPASSAAASLAPSPPESVASSASSACSAPSAASSSSSSSSASSSSASDLNFPEISGRYRVLSKIGEGTFSCVFMARTLKEDGSEGSVVALKRVYPTSSPTRVMNEIKFLKAVGGRHNVGPLVRCHRYKGYVTLVMPYFEHVEFKEYFSAMSVDNIRSYMKALFEALAHIHKKKVIHRDIKPANFLHCPSSNKYMLVDFGLAQYQETDKDPQRRIASRAGTRGFRSPEVLMRHIKQTTAIDVWSAGVILLCILSGRYPFFNSPDDMTALVEIASVLGSREVIGLATTLEKSLTLPKEFERQDLKQLCTRLMSPVNAPDEAYDLLGRCLDLHPRTRITAAKALKHPFLTGTTVKGLRKKRSLAGSI